MPQWKNTDAAGNSVLWATTGLGKAPTAANRTAAFGNTTANGYGTSQTIGVYGVTPGEMRALRLDQQVRPAGPGWVIRKEGSGGRAGRVTYETLVAMRSMTGDATDDTVLKDASIAIDTNPADATGDISNNDIVKFTALGHAVPTQAVTYKWQKWGGAAFANVADAGAYSNTATVELSVLANVETTGAIYRCGVYSTGATTKYTGNAVITIVA